MTAPSFEFVVSAENCEYMAWQCLVFHHSCVRHFTVAPLIIVHGDEPRLIEPYRRLEAKGGRIQRAPNYRMLRGYEYPPRNSAATLLHARSNSDYLIMCDPDIVFVDDRLIALHPFAPDTLSFDSVSYLLIDDENRPGLSRVCEQFGIGVEVLDDMRSSGGVPHIVPRDAQMALAKEWLACLEAFIPNEPASEPGCTLVDWLTLASMWSLRIAARRVGLRPMLTHYCETNHDSDRMWPDPKYPDACMIHYCYGDAGFNKRNFPALTARPRPASPTPQAPTVDSILRASIGDALQSFGY